jgi:hypothetical protein
MRAQSTTVSTAGQPRPARGVQPCRSCVAPRTTGTVVAPLLETLCCQWVQSRGPSASWGGLRKAQRELGLVLGTFQIRVSHTGKTAGRILKSNASTTCPHCRMIHYQ